MKSGPPIKEITSELTPDHAYFLGSRMFTASEICKLYEISMDTFQRRKEIADAWRRGKQRAKLTTRGVREPLFTDLNEYRD